MSFDNANLEHCLYQKLTLMANAVARISSVKSHLRNSAERTRKDISNAIDHQLSCVRAREQDLLFNLERIVSEKEQKLCEQQEQLNQAIGACQQSLEYLLQNNANVKGNSSTNIHDLANMTKMLLKMNSLELRPKDTSNILFEFDPSDMRRDIAVFGKVIAIDHQNAKAAAESLPMEVEHYEDEGFLSHKSVLRLSQMSSSPAYITDKGDQDSSSICNSINSWLTQIKQHDMERKENFETNCLRNRLTSGSSFDIISEKENASNGTVFDAHFSEINEKPLCHWLRKADNANENKSSETRTNVPQHLSKLIKEIKERNNGAEAMETEREMEKCEVPHFVFGDVIKAIQSSRDDDWLLYRKKAELFCSQSAKTNSLYEEHINNNKPSHWLRKFPNMQSMERKPTPPDDDDDDFLTRESILEWKKVLEKIHSSNQNDWIAQKQEQKQQNISEK